VTQWEVGLSKQLDYTGTRVSLGYKGTNSDFQLRSFSTGVLGDTYFGQNTYSLGIVQPLLKDFGARGHSILKRKAEAQTGSARMMNRHGAAAVLFEARAAYVSLAAARMVAALLEESLERNQKILQWTEDKFADNLVDKVDVLQVQAALHLVKSGLSAAREELKNSAEKFNTLRGAESAKEIGDLEALGAPSGLPEAKGERFDLLAAEKTVEGNAVMAEEVNERYFPDLSLMASVAGSGGDAPDPVGKGENAFPDHPTYLVGLKLTTTLDIPLYKKVVDAASMAVTTGQDDMVQRKLKIQLERRTLQGQWDTVQEQLVLARELEAIQKEKAEREKKRYQDGRTTNFQVLRFDEDYAQARIATLRLTAQAAILAAQADFYNGGGITW
jgi:outer membrane protein TolC